MHDFTDTYPMLPHRMDAETVKRVRACSSDACHQGRRSCPTPAACELPEWVPLTTGEAVRLWAGVIVAFCVLLACFGAALIHFWPALPAFFEEIL